MYRLTVTTYNTYRERKGCDRALDDLLSEDGFICLQELGVERAWELWWRFGRRVYLSPVMFGWEFLAIVLPKNATFTARRAVQLNSRFGVVPAGWSLQRARILWRAGRRSWRDAMTPRTVQVCNIRWRRREFRLLHTHLPYEPGLRDQCLRVLAGLVGDGDALLCGDLNGTTRDVHLGDLLLATGLQPSGSERPTHRSGRRIDYVAFRGGIREVGYVLKGSRSDHRLVRVELEVA